MIPAHRPNSKRAPLSLLSRLGQLLAFRPTRSDLCVLYINFDFIILVQLSLGIPSYGHSFLVNSSSALGASGQLVLNSPFSGTPKGDKWDGGPGKVVIWETRYRLMETFGNLGPDSCGTVINRPGGIFNFFGLVDAGFLQANGSVAAGIDYFYDNCSQTVRARNTPC